MSAGHHGHEGVERDRYKGEILGVPAEMVALNMNLLRRDDRGAAADRPEAHVRRGTLARRLILAVTALLVPLVVVTSVGVVMFRSSISSLEEFQRESIEETARVVEARDLLALSDDVGEQYVEAHDSVSGEEFRSIGRRLIRSLDGLSDLSSEQEIAIIAKVRARWVKIDSELNEAAKIPLGDPTDVALDPFHDHIDDAISMLADLNELRGVEIADEIATMRRSEQLQLLFGLAMLGVGIASAFLLARWARGAITDRLGLLEGAAMRIGSDDLSHRIEVGGDDELTRVGDAFNTMAGTLERSRTDLERQAYHDPLTGLANRELFMDRIGHAKNRARRGGEPFSVLYLDLDGFKLVNDSRGHHVGDDVLQVAATRMAACLRPEDTLARLGGDEFAGLLEETGAAAAAEVADRLVHAVGDTPFAGHDLSIGVSVGITTGGTHDDIDRLLREADAAMYSVKANGGSAWQAFDPVAHLDGVRAQSLRAELQRAAEQHEFVVHYQPVVRLETGAVEAVEALVRWQHPERGLLPPETFLDAAAATGQILFIDNWVMHEACRQVKAWQTSIPGAAGLSAYVNFSATQLRHPGLASSIADALRATGLRAQDLVVEMTEGAIVHDVEAAATELQQLRKLGVRIALDDFGTGYSSMSHLLRFPVDIIKVDRSFVSQMDDCGQGSNLAQALVTFGRTMGFQTICEGIEQPHQLGLLRSVHCELGQGYLFAKPLDADQLGEILSRSLTKSGVRGPSAVAHVPTIRVPVA